MLNTFELNLTRSVAHLARFYKLFIWCESERPRSLPVFWWKYKSQCLQFPRDVQNTLLKAWFIAQDVKAKKNCLNGFESATSALITTIFTNFANVIDNWTIWWSSVEYMPHSDHVPNADQWCGNRSDRSAFRWALVWLPNSLSRLAAILHVHDRLLIVLPKTSQTMTLVNSSYLHGEGLPIILPIVGGTWILVFFLKIIFTWCVQVNSKLYL